jgi:hypothetical protein
VPRRRGRIYGGAEQAGRRGASPEAIVEAVGDESKRVEGGARSLRWLSRVCGLSGGDRERSSARGRGSIPSFTKCHNSVAHLLVGCATELENSVAHPTSRCATEFISFFNYFSYYSLCFNE